MRIIALSCEKDMLQFARLFLNLDIQARMDPNYITCKLLFRRYQ